MGSQFFFLDVEVEVANEDGGLVVEIVVETQRHPEGVVFNFATIHCAGLLSRLLLLELDVGILGLCSSLVVLKDAVGFSFKGGLLDRNRSEPHFADLAKRSKLLLYVIVCEIEGNIANKDGRLEILWLVLLGGRWEIDWLP